ncbi:MAG: CDP-alcohol phosphatidyltransferase family protein [Chloroflexota bacterium]
MRGMFGPVFESRVRGVSMQIMRPVARSRITPNNLTVLGLVLNIVTAVVIGGGYLFVSGVLLLFAGVFDMADGALARVKDASSEFGDFLDATLDRLAEGSVGLGLLWHALVRHDDLQVGLIYAVVLGSIMISYARARAEVLNLDCEVGLMPRPERIVILAVGLILAQATAEVALTVILAALCLSTYYTVAQRIVHVYRITRGTEQGMKS